MCLRATWVAAVTALAGCAAAPAAGPVVEVTASYPGASAGVVAEVVAAPIEQQINGVEGMAWLESESGDDGSYVARVHFHRRADAALVLVRNRVALANPLLPEAVRLEGVATRASKASGRPAVVLQDRGNLGFEALDRWAAATRKRVGAGATERFPGPVENRIVPQIDFRQLARLGVTAASVRAAIEKAGPTATVEPLRETTITTGGRKGLIGEPGDVRRGAGSATGVSGKPVHGRANNRRVAGGETQRGGAGGVGGGSAGGTA